MAKQKMTQAEKDAYDSFKKLLQKPQKLKNKDFYPGALIMYVYDAKDQTKTFDQRPLGLILGHSKKYTLALNFNWCPPKLREKIMDGIMKQNKANIKKNRPLTVNYNTVKKLVQGLGPVVRLYLNNRISPKGIVVPSYQYYKVIHLRSEHFIGMSANAAWRMAIASHKANKKKKAQLKKAQKAAAKINAKKAQSRIDKKKVGGINGR
jgi:hypothetical protein